MLSKKEHLHLTPPLKMSEAIYQIAYINLLLHFLRKPKD